MNRTVVSEYFPGRTLRLVLAAALSISAPGAFAEESVAAPVAQEAYDPACRSMTAPGRVPPSDYRKATQRWRDTVENYHFNEHYSAYLAGKNKFQKKIDRIIESPVAGFNYTLWAFPNHPQALAAMEDLGFRDKTENPQGAELQVHCYFQRAIKLTPDDAMVRTLYGYYFARRKLPNEARGQFALVDPERAKSDRNIQSYMAWAYISVGDLDAAVAHAAKAYELGLELPGLKSRLAKLGRALPLPTPPTERAVSN